MLSEIGYREVQAFNTARLYHEGQKEKQGTPYFFHLLRVAGMCKTPDEVCVTFLHDTIEDTQYSSARLYDDFGGYIYDAVMKLTRDKANETYEAYIDRIKGSTALVRNIKRYDLIDHLNQDPRNVSTEKWLKYQRAIVLLGRERETDYDVYRLSP